MRLADDRTAGFTIVEILVALTVSVVLLAAIYQILIGQSRLYSSQNALLDVRANLRATASLLAWELRQASAPGGDLYSIDEHSVVLRSIRGTAIVCAEHPSQPRYGLWSVSGEFETTAIDSALLFAAGNKGTQDDDWRVVALSNTWTSGGGVPSCWGDVAPTELVVQVAGNTDSVRIGGPIRSFRKVEYGLYEDEGRWWLGRKVAGAGDYERLTGPLLPPADSGLALVYYDADGDTTSVIAEVVSVDVVLRAESLIRAPQANEAPDFKHDSLTLRTSLRNSLQ